MEEDCAIILFSSSLAPEFSCICGWLAEGLRLIAQGYRAREWQASLRPGRDTPSWGINDRLLPWPMVPSLVPPLIQFNARSDESFHSHAICWRKDPHHTDYLSPITRGVMSFQLSSIQEVMQQRRGGTTSYRTYHGRGFSSPVKTLWVTRTGTSYQEVSKLVFKSDEWGTFCISYSHLLLGDWHIWHVVLKIIEKSIFQ